MWPLVETRTEEQGDVVVGSIAIRPCRYRQFGPSEGCVFCLVTNSALLGTFLIEELGPYADCLVVPYDEGDSFEDILRRCIPESAHILVASPYCFFRSPTPETLGYRKLMMMACNSTPTSPEAVRYFLDVIERTD